MAKIFVPSGTTSSGFELNGSMYVNENAIAKDAVINRGAYLYISSGGSGLDIKENGGAVVYDAEATVSFAPNTFSGAVVSQSIITVHSGTTASSTTLGYAGSMYIYDGGLANGINANSNFANVCIYNGGSADNLNFGSNAKLYVGEGGAAGNVSVAGATAYVSNGGAVRGLTAGRFAEIYVSSGGSGLDIKENGGAVVYDAEAKVSFVSNTFTGAVASQSFITVHSGTTAVSTTLGYAGSMYIYDGGLANGINVNSNFANVRIYDGGSASNVNVNSNAKLYVCGGDADNFKVGTNGQVIVESGGWAVGGSVTSKGTLYVSGGGTAEALVVSEGGCVYVGSDGWLTGKLTLTGIVSAYEGGLVDFDISGLSAGNTALINNLSRVVGAPTFTVTVSESQAFGTYSLAEGAANFTDYVAVINAVGDVLDWVCVGESGNYEDRDFTLVNNSDKLSLTVSKAVEKAPEVLSVTADLTASTNKNVTVTATYSTNTATKQYSLDNKTWQAYTTGVTMTQNGTVYFRGLTKSGKVSEIKSYQVTNIDKVAPAKPTAKANVTTSTTGSVTVTATFSNDSAQKQYSTDNKTWKTYTSGVVFTKNGTAYFRGIDAAGNVSTVTSYKVSNITGTISLDGDTTKSGSYQSENLAKPNCAGFYRLTGSFGVMKGTITILAGGKKVAAGTLKNGVLVFNKGKDVLLDSINYTIVVKNTDKGKTASAYSMKLTATERFDKGNTTDDTQAKAQTLAAGTPANDWVGYGDAVDYYKLGVDARGGFYDFSISGVRNNVKLTIYAADGRKVKGVAASAKKSAVALANLCLANGSYAVIEAPKAAKAQNSDYTLKLTQKAVFTGAKNNDWSQAEVLAKGATFTGALTKAAGGDTVDYCDVSKIDSLTFDMTEGKTKVSFFDAQHNAVKAAVKLANGADKTAASLTLAAGNAATDHFTIAAIDDAVKYLKIEAAGKTLNGYTITKIA